MVSTTTWWYNLILITLLGMGTANAQTFEDGYQSYVRNQFPVAELQFKGALKRARTDEDRAFIQKFIGICQYMRGDKRGAGNSFQQSVSLDSNVQIDEEEVLDPSVVSFFNAIKAKTNSEPKKKVAAELPPPPKPKAQVNREPVRKFNKAPPKKKSQAFVSDDSSRDKNEDSIDSDRQSPRPKQSPINVLHFLPFGVGQFYNGAPFLGTVVASAQVFSLYLVFDADKIIEERQALNGVVAGKADLNEEQRRDFYIQNEAFIQNIRQDRSTALLSFGLIYAAGVTEAILRRPSDSRSRSSLNLTPATHAGEQAYVLNWKMNF